MPSEAMNKQKIIGNVVNYEPRCDTPKDDVNYEAEEHDALGRLCSSALIG